MRRAAKTSRGECCVNEATFCVPKEGLYPSRCCPLWTVGCGVGSVGCCDPARPWQRDFPPPAPAPGPAPSPPTPTPAPQGGFYQLQCDDSQCTEGCQTVPFPIGTCVKIGGGGSAIIASCSPEGIVEKVFPRSAACSGVPETHTEEVGKCLQNSQGSYYKNLCANGTHSTHHSSSRKLRWTGVRKGEAGSTGTVGRAAAGPKAFGVFVTGSFETRLAVVAMNLTGHVLHKVDVTGPVATWYKLYYGESTRLFTFDPKNGKFLFADTAADSVPTLYSIDATDGSSTKQAITGGMKGYPVGYAFHPETGVFVVSTVDSGAFEVWGVDPATGKATLKRKIPRGATEGSADYYAGYMSEVSADLSHLYRLGYREVTQQTSPGLGISMLTGSSSGTWEAISTPNTTLFYYTLARSGERFVSLAPSKFGDQSFYVVLWGVKEAPKVLGLLNNAHPPKSLLGNLGYIADAFVGDNYAALTIQKNGGFGMRDQWALAWANTATGHVTYNTFTPDIFPFGAEATSLSGFGVTQG
eukprot:Sspe_Gene.29638::Locus_14191_Transcript_4_7_Confidence_0.364_Length_1921::g.29638::m.29638